MELRPEIEDILVKECTNQALTAAEQRVLSAWLKQNKKHRSILAQMRLAFLYPDAENRTQLQDEVWTDLQNRLLPVNTRPEKEQKRNYWTKVAVVLLVCLSLGLLILRRCLNF